MSYNIPKKINSAQSSWAIILYVIPIMYENYAREDSKCLKENTGTKLEDNKSK